MAPRHVIVDGSNLATEGRSMPSLAQLDQAVREFIAENPTDVVTVVVDASFGHRIDPSEVAAFEGAETAGEVVSPPAGAIGRGDAFLLRIAEKTGATVLSNDSFQEFHGEHTWLFEKGRLIGGKPVPGVGWIFMDRTPVRGAKSREVTKEAKHKKRVEVEGATKSQVGSEPKGKSRPKAVDRAIARATEEVTEPKAAGSKRRRRGGEPPSEPVNEPLAFITFIAAHPLGTEVVGSVFEYSSHGAFVDADGARCYLPLSAMGDPPPRRAREAVTKGTRAPFVVQAFDPPRRGIELALPGFAKVAGSPTAETVEAEIAGEASAPAATPRRRARKVAGPVVDATPAAPAKDEPAPARSGRAKKAAPADGAVAEASPSRRSRTKAAAADAPVKKTSRTVTKAAAPPGGAPARARKAPAAKKVAAPATEPTPVPAKKTAATSKKAAARKAPPERAPAKKAPAEKAPAKSAAAANAPAAKAPAKKVAAKKATSSADGTGGARPEKAAKRPAAKKAVAGNDPAGNGAGSGLAPPAGAGRRRGSRPAPPD